MEPAVAKLGHVAFVTPDLEESSWFFQELMGLQEVERAGGTVYLRGLRDWDHHTIRLRQGGETALEHIAWRTQAPEDVTAFGKKFESQSLAVEWLEPGDVRSIGEAVRVYAPGGHPFLFYYDVEQPAAPEDSRSRLHNRRYSPEVANRVACRRIDHVHLLDPEGDPLADWLADDLDFRMNERFQSADGTFWGWWLARTALPHDIAVHRNDAGPSFHHVSYHVDHLRDLWDAADICREHGIAPDGGPGKHAITNADFFYVRDPGSDIRLELFAGPGYLNFEPDWEPIDWQADEIGTEHDHQWIGTQYSETSIPYRTP